MSTAPLTRSADFSLARPGHTCSVTGQPIAPDEPFMAALRETAQGFERLDVKLDAWPTLPQQDILAFWRATMPKANAKKRQFVVDDAALCDLLERLEGVDVHEKQAFRFVLALILMRKRLAIYEGTKTVDGVEHWQMRLRGRNGTLSIVDAKPTEEQIAAVSTQLGEILNEEQA